MKVRYTAGNKQCAFDVDKDYEVVSTECGWYRIVDESGEDYLFPPQLFTITEQYPIPPVTQPAPMPDDMLE